MSIHNIIKYRLTEGDWEIVKKNRVFLYRDGIRVQLIRTDDEYTEKKVVVEKNERLRGIISAMEAVLADMKNLFASTQHKSKSIRVRSERWY